MSAERRTAPPPERPMLGILAGMGPRSTTPFLEAVLDECVRQYGAELDADFPPMMIHSLPTPFVLHGPVDHHGMRRAIRAGLERLAAADAAVIAVPCNVAHAYFDAVARDDLGVPVLDLVDASVNAVPETARTVTVLATRQTLEADLYGRGLRSRGFDTTDGSVYQASVDRLIAGVKGGHRPADLDREWDGLVGRLTADGVDCAVLGSTDLSAVGGAVRETRVRVVDSGAALAAELVAWWCAAAGEPAREDRTRDTHEGHAP